MKKHFSVYWYMYLLGALLALMIAVYCRIVDMVDQNAGNIISTYHLTDVESEEITAISYFGNKKQEISFVKKEDGNWVYALDESLELEQAGPQYLVELFKKVTSEYQIENAEDISLYGLSKESPYVEITTAEKTCRIYIGNYNETVQRYYACLDGETTIYGLKQEIAEVLDYTLNHYLKGE